MSNPSVKRTLVLLLLITLTLLLVVTGCGIGKQSPPLTDASASPPQASPAKLEKETPKPMKPEPTPIEAQERVTKVTLAAVGDVLIHSSIYKDARTKDGYDFTPMFDKIKTYIDQADIAIANLESMIGGEQLGLSDYPRFNAPYEVGDALQATGFDLVNLANNHTLDRGEKALQNTIQHLSQLGIEYTGAYSSPEDQQRIRVLNQHDISFAFVSYTYGTNGIPVPEGKPYLVNLIDLPAVTEDVKKARQLADVVIVQVHFGQEYVDLPDEQQKLFARTAAEAGADIIIGHHPHVLQPTEWLISSSGRKTFVVYSLGNFIAAQEGKRKRIGGILQLEIHKLIKGTNSRIELHNPAFLPTWTAMSNWRHYRVLPLLKAPEAQLPNAQHAYKEIELHMKQWMPELKIIEE